MKREKDSPRVFYTPRPDATPEGELNALADVYAFILKCGQERRQAGVSGAGVGTKGPENEVSPAPRT